MPEEQKKNAEEQHRFVQKFLVKNFPDCEVIYNGNTGFDHEIIYKERSVWVETKSCLPIISGGIDKKKMKESDRAIVFTRNRLGRLKFNRDFEIYPYNISQHDDLVSMDGWYIFVISGQGTGGHKIKSGMPARNLKLSEKQNTKWKVWSSVINQCSPGWLDELKHRVYHNMKQNGVVHYKSNHCGTIGFSSILTNNKYEVTCKYCLLKLSQLPPVKTGGL